MGYIYMLTSPSGKSYIGQTTKTVEERFRQHQQKNNRCVAIYNAIQYHGWDAFEKNWYEVPDGDLNKHEELMIEVLGTLSPDGYNLREGGGSNKPSEETKQKIRETHIGMTHTEESKQKMSESRIGDNNHFYGRTHSEETIRQMKEAQFGEKHHSSKKIYQYELDGTYIRSFASSGEATRCLGKKSSSTIRRCARGDQETAHGFKWSHTKS